MATSIDPQLGDDLEQWMTNVVESAPSDDGEPLSLRERPLENWNLLVIGETNTLTSRSDTEALLARVRAGTAVPERKGSRTVLLVGIVLGLLCAAIAMLAWHGLR